MIFHAFYCKTFTLRTQKDQELVLEFKTRNRQEETTYGGFEMGTPHNGYITSYKNKAKIKPCRINQILWGEFGYKKNEGFLHGSGEKEIETEGVES